MARVRYQRRVKAAPHVAGIATAINTVLPVITGDTAGEDCTTSNGTWTNSSAFTYQWYLDGVLLAGETASTITTDAGWSGQTLTVVVYGGNGAGKIGATSLGVELQYSGPLDLVPGAIAAFSQRALSADYLGGEVFTLSRGGAISASTLANGGNRWNVNDTFTLSSFTGNAVGVVDTVSPAQFGAAITAISQGGNRSINAVDQGLQTFSVTGDASGTLAAGIQFDVNGSTGNDNIYTTVTAIFGGGSTVITVAEAIPDATADGDVVVPGFATISGNHVSSFSGATYMQVSGSTGNDGGYQVQAATLSAGNTRVFLLENTFPDATADGALLTLTAVATYHLTASGTGYYTAANVGADSDSGYGTGLALDITASSATQAFNCDASTGTTPTTSIIAFIGSAVGNATKWNDQSGNGLDSLGDSGGYSKWQNGVANAKPGFVSGQGFDSIVTVDVPNGAGTLFAVLLDTAALKLENAGDGTALSFSLSVDSSGQNAVMLINDGSGGKWQQFTPPAGFDGVIAIHEMKGNGDTWSYKINGIAAEPGDEISGSPSGFVGAATNFSWSKLSGNPGAVLAEVIIYPTVLSSGNASMILQNIAAYYGITLS